jgi:hypothetical protein
VKRVALTPVEHALALMAALTLADVGFGLPWTLSFSYSDLAYSVADGIPSGIAVAILAHRKRGPIAALVAALLVCALSLVAGPAARASSFSALEKDVSEHAGSMYFTWSGPIIVLGTALAFFAASRLRGHLAEGVAFAAPQTLAWFVQIGGEFGIGRELLLGLLAFSLTLAFFVPLFERGIALVFAKLGITDSEAAP